MSDPTFALAIDIAAVLALTENDKVLADIAETKRAEELLALMLSAGLGGSSGGTTVKFENVREYEW